MPFSCPASCLQCPGFCFVVSRYTINNKYYVVYFIIFRLLFLCLCCVAILIYSNTSILGLSGRTVTVPTVAELRLFV